jgi:predicted O-methyltransferase YrrM
LSIQALQNGNHQLAGQRPVPQHHGIASLTDDQGFKRSGRTNFLGRVAGIDALALDIVRDSRKTAGQIDERLTAQLQQLAGAVEALGSRVAGLEAELSKIHDLLGTNGDRLQLQPAVLPVQEQLRRLAEWREQLHPAFVTAQGNLARLNEWRDRQLREAAGPGGVELQDALNGQLSKMEMFTELVAAKPMRVAVETGTFRGWTTRYLAGRFRHVVTFENDIANIEQARAHCAVHPNISFVHGDSARIERAWADIPIPTEEIDFAYLDAHWGEHCPLNEELDFLLGKAPNAIIFIDDFKVEDDGGYGYDSYPSMTLDLEHIRGVLEAHDAVCFSPVRRGVNDTCIYYRDIDPRGTVVVVPRAMQATLAQARTVRPAVWREA